ncbi:uncharacterized protein [Leptinotarsa decemlineata]|uniref:uncharacterized protein n=1 Tax=Leptinotarsa decemlineata TaxID=7539 RepID=UPI003D30BFD0
MNIYSCYISPNIPINEYKGTTDAIMQDVMDQGKEAVIAGDFNAKSPLWGAPHTDERGNYLTDWIATLDLTIHNNGNPTFERGVSKSHIDITMTTNRIASKVKDWKTMDEETMSQHKYIHFHISTMIGEKRQWNKKPYLNKATFRKIVERELKNDSTPTVDNYLSILASAQRSATMARKGKVEVQPYWWNDEIFQKKADCNEMRRRITKNHRKSHDASTTIMEEQLKQLRRELQKMIRKSKREQWRELCRKLEEDIWEMDIK